MNKEGMMQEGRATKGGYREAQHREEEDKEAPCRGMLYKEEKGKWWAGRAVFFLALSRWLWLIVSE